MLDWQFEGQVVDGLVLCRLPPTVVIGNLKDERVVEVPAVVIAWRQRSCALFPSSRSGDWQFEGRFVNGLVLYRLPPAAVIGNLEDE